MLGQACGRSFHKDPERNKGSDCSNGRQGDAKCLFAGHGSSSRFRVPGESKLNLKSVFYLYPEEQLVKPRHKDFFLSGIHRNWRFRWMNRPVLFSGADHFPDRSRKFLWKHLQTAVARCQAKRACAHEVVFQKELNCQKNTGQARGTLVPFQSAAGHHTPCCNDT